MTGRAVYAILTQWATSADLITGALPAPGLEHLGIEFVEAVRDPYRGVLDVIVQGDRLPEWRPGFEPMRFETLQSLADFAASGLSYREWYSRAKGEAS